MPKDRIIRSRRRGLNPTKVVFVYCLAFVLVCFHQAGGLADWFDDLALKHDGFVSETAFGASKFFREKVKPYGPAQLNGLENMVLGFFTGEARGPLAQSETRELSLGGRLDRVPPEEVGEGISSSAEAMARELRPKGRQDDEVQNEGPYAELPPIYWSRKPLPPEPVVTTPSEDEIKTASLFAPDDLSIFAKKNEILRPEVVLLLGDSMMLEGLGPPLQRTLKQNQGLKVYRDGRYGTGLTRLDNFDWLNYFDEILDKYGPDLVILTLGANDAQDMVGEGKRVHLGSEPWKAAYTARVTDLLARAEARGTTVFWVGLPIMGQEPYGTRIAAINKLTYSACEAVANCRFWDSWLSVADSKGKYATYLSGSDGKSVRVRAKDSIHLTEVGGRIMADKFLDDIAGWADFNPRGSDEKGAGEPVPDDGSVKSPAPSAGDEDGGERPEGEFRRLSLRSQVRSKETFYNLALPRLETGKAYPLVLLLHGAWDRHDAWAKNIGPEKLAELADRFGLVLLMPDGESFGWYVDGREAAIESYLVKELLPHVIGLYPEIDSGKIGITGLSMGGHGALTLTMKHPDLFKATGAMSALTDLTGHAASRHKVDQELQIEKAIGPAGKDGRNWKPFSARWMTVDKPDFWRGRPLIISVGRDDSLTAAENLAYHRLLSDLELEHLYREREGGHDWKYWRSELPDQLEFMSRQLHQQNGL